MSAQPTPTPDWAISVQDVSKTFIMHSEGRSTLKERFVRGNAKGREEFHALDSVSFDIKRGTTFGLIGHNGSGKSTMLKILAGVYRPSSGSVEVTGRVDALLELGAGFHGELTGRENIYLNGAILGRSRKQIDESLDWIIEFADIGEFIDVPVKVYSSGMTVRLGFAVAVAVTPEILVVDEIIAVGDEEFQRKCFELMRALRDRGTTVALVTHSLSLATEMCDEIVWMDHGKVRAIGDANEVVSAYLADVNAREHAKRIAKTHSNPGDEEDDDELYRENQGTGEVVMTRVEFLDSAGKLAPFLTTGRSGTIRIHGYSKRELPQVEVGLAFSTDNGVTIAGPNSKHSSILYDVPRGDFYVDYEMQSLVIQPRRLLVTTAFVHDGHIYDYSDRRTELVVRGETTMDEPGLVTLPKGSWSPTVQHLPAPAPNKEISGSD